MKFGSVWATAYEKYLLSIKIQEKEAEKATDEPTPEEPQKTEETKTEETEVKTDE